MMMGCRQIVMLLSLVLLVQRRRHQDLSALHLGEYLVLQLLLDHRVSIAMMSRVDSNAICCSASRMVLALFLVAYARSADVL
ncbi:hypothetical protein EJB05_24061, partial [Eragrostis curvula]